MSVIMNFLKLKIPPPIYALSIGFLMWLINQALPLMDIIDQPWNRVGLAMILIAGTLDLWSLFLFMKKKTTVNPMSPKNTSGLVVNGLYKISRNPMYVGMLIMLLGYAIWLGTLGPFILVPLFYLVITEMQIKPEEKILESKFGQEYLEYKRKVKRWL